MSHATAMLERYMERMGLRGYLGDALYHYQLTLLREWIATLEDILINEDLPPETCERITRQFVYGAIPGAADAEYRKQERQKMTELLNRRVWPKIDVTGIMPPGVPG